MSVLISGDFHANTHNELKSISKKRLKGFYKQEYDSIKYHIILGDGDFNYPGNEKVDHSNYKALSFRPFPVLFLMSHRDRILEFDDVQEVDIGIGDTVYQINDEPFAAYLKRGKAYTIDGLKILALGGGIIDKKEKQIRVGIRSEKEIWLEQEKQEIFKLLETDNNFDFVVSHTAPCNINDVDKTLTDYKKFKKLFENTRETAFFYDELREKITFGEWWCGFRHENYIGIDKSNRFYQFIYKSSNIIEKKDDKITITYFAGNSRNIKSFT